MKPVQVFFLVGTLFGWTDGPGTHRGSAEMASVYARSELRFSTADFFKPRRKAQEEGAVYRPPLILQEVRVGVDEPPRADHFGTFMHLGGEQAQFKPDLATVYFTETTATWGGNVHPQVSYLWHYSPDSTLSGKGAPLTQGLRLTLDGEGFPALVEVLNDSSALRIVFVARRLEMAAAREYGKALPGRRFSIERSLEEQPRVVVPDVFEDGPEPMGPMVYLRARSRDVAAVACRCMPSLVEEIRERRRALGSGKTFTGSRALSGGREVSERDRSGCQTG
jgi:hypothetical protein